MKNGSFKNQGFNKKLRFEKLDRFDLNKNFEKKSYIIDLFYLVKNSINLKIIVYYFFSVLDGEIAVPCSLKAAYAGLNSKRRVVMMKIVFISGVDFSALRNITILNPVRSGKKQR